MVAIIPGDFDWLTKLCDVKDYKKMFASRSDTSTASDPINASATEAARIAIECRYDSSARQSCS